LNGGTLSTGGAEKTVARQLAAPAPDAGKKTVIAENLA